VRIEAHQVTILECARFAFIRVADDELVAGEVAAVMAAVKMYAIILLLSCKSVTLCVQVQSRRLSMIRAIG